jgi:acetyl-CoA carboxylase biotin carboxyl carrier protein
VIGGRSPPFDADAALIKKLAALLDETGLSEIEYAVGDRRVRVARAPAIAAAVPATAPAVAAPTLPPPREAVPAGAVTAPMVGTVYLAPQPGEAPFVRLGDAVAAGQPLLIIEAMKVMNQIRAPHPGRVKEILVADAQPIEYGAPLMVIE